MIPTESDPERATARTWRRRLARGLAVPALLGLLALVGLALFADTRELLRAVDAFAPSLLLPVLALSLVNYGLRFLRWQIYLRRLDIELGIGRSLAVFLTGFLLSITPGKAGELGKGWLVRELGGGPARRGTVAVLGERLTDLLGVVVLVALGAILFPGGRWLAAAGLALCAAVMALLAWPRGAEAILGRLATSPRRARWAGVARDVIHGLRGLTRPWPLLVAVTLATLAWGAEGVGFYLVARSYSPSVPLPVAVFDYGVATLVGALSMLPGGLLASEGTMAALLDNQGLGRAAAASATLIVRAATLWFAVVLGLAALPLVLGRLARRRGGPRAAGEV